MNESRVIHVSITLNETQDTATIVFSSRRVPVVAGCLGIDRNENNEITAIYLDSLLETRECDVYSGWRLSGAVSTILSKTETRQ